MKSVYLEMHLQKLFSIKEHPVRTFLSGEGKRVKHCTVLFGKSQSEHYDILQKRFWIEHKRNIKIIKFKSTCSRLFFLKMKFY